MSFMVNITKMSLENGVMGLPVDVCRNWNALTSIPGKLIYAGRECPITFSPKHQRKHSDDVYGSAGAWQFTINDSIQFSKLRIDGVYIYAEGEKARIEKVGNKGSERIHTMVLSLQLLPFSLSLRTDTNRYRQKQSLQRSVSAIPVWNGHLY